MKYIFMFFSLYAVVALAQNFTDASGKKQGKWVKYYPDGRTPIYEGNFKDDYPVGEFRYYYPSGKVKTIVQHETKMRSYAWFYFENEQIMSEGQYVNMQKDSLWKSYDIHGNLVSTEFFKNNRLNGPKEVYYLHNQLETAKLTIARKETYKDSLLHGPYNAYFSNGNLKEKGYFDKGLKSGAWEIYHPSGALDTQIKYRGGKAYGYVITYDDKGTELYRSYWLNGKMLKGEALKKYFAECEQKGEIPEE